MGGRSRRDRNETTGTLGNIDLKLAMRCQVLLEAGRVLEAKSDISGARAKYEEVRGLGIYFQAMDIGSQVIAGAQLAINNAESISPNLNERVPEKMKHETVEAPDIHDKALEGDNRGSEDAEGDSEALISVKRRRMDEYEEDGTTTANASANISETINIIADSKAMSWAQGVSSSSLAFAKEMDSRIEARTCQALTGIADTTKINSAVTCIGCSDLRAAAASLKELLLTAEEAWVVDHMNFEPNKTDPSKTNARCKFPWCGKLFKEEKFLRKHLLSKHATQLNYQLELARKPLLRERLEADSAQPLPLLECNDGSGHPMTVDPIDILNGKFVATPLPPPSIRGQERSAGPTKRRPPQQSLRSRPHVRVNYDDADAPKDEAAVDVTYSEDLGDLVAPPPKKKKKKKNT